MLSQLPESLRTRDAFAALFDHTLLKPDATPPQIKQLCQEARSIGAHTVCVNPCYVALASSELSGSRVLPISVVGFPLGSHRTDIKIDETLRAIGDGAREIDMVINVGWFLGGEASAVRHDIAAVVRAAESVPVKVILETSLLTQEQVHRLSQWAAEAGAAFVKTSTGFGARGASEEDIRTMRRALSAYPRVGVKASGGIRTLDSAVGLVAAGATRIGSSATVTLLAEFDKQLN